MNIVGMILDFVFGAKLAGTEDVGKVLDAVTARFAQATDTIKGKVDIDGDGYVNVRELWYLFKYVTKLIKSVFRDMLKALEVRRWR